MSRILVKDERQLAPPARQNTGTLVVGTNGAGFTDLTPHIVAWLGRIAAGDGLVAIFVLHTSASLTIQENADPDVLRDLADALGRLAPESAGWRHASEGPDDMPSHIKAALTDTSLTLPVLGGAMPLGRWQAIYLIEHRADAHQREIVLHFLGS